MYIEDAEKEGLARRLGEKIRFLKTTKPAVFFLSLGLPSLDSKQVDPVKYASDMDRKIPKKSSLSGLSTRTRTAVSRTDTPPQPGQSLQRQQ